MSEQHITGKRRVIVNRFGLIIGRGGPAGSEMGLLLSECISPA